MTLDNLAIILSPNLMFTSKEKDTDKYHKDQTEIVDLLFKNANSIGLVNDEISDKLNALESEVTSVSTSSADELDWCAQNTQRRLRRRRSRSISGETAKLLAIALFSFSVEPGRSIPDS